MSPRRMDISSLLRDPSPSPPDFTRNLPPASLLSILNSTTESPRYPSHHHHHHPSPPFLGLSALVHVASEERRRISASSETHAVRHDHDRPSRYPYPAPLHRHPDVPSQDSASPHKRTCPPSPSPEPRLPPLTSPTTPRRPSASPTNNYPTLRRQLHSEPAPPLSANDVRPFPHPPSHSLQHPFPFSPSLHPSPPLIHSSPRNNSPHRQYLRSQHISSPIHSGSPMPTSADTDVMSPRSTFGPRMAGGIQVFSNDPSPVRDPPRLDLSNYQSPGRDVSTKRSRAEHTWHEPSKPSSLPGRVFPLDDERHRSSVPHHQVESQESMLLRERVRSRPLHSPSVDSTPKHTGLAEEADFLPQPPPERHPIRVWEEQPTAREISRRVSPAHMPDILYRPAEEPTWPRASGSRHDERSGRVTELRQDLVEDVPTPPLSTCKQPSPPRAPTLERTARDLQTPVGVALLDPQPPLPTPVQPVQSEPRTHFSQASLLNPTPRAPASPVLDFHLKNLEPQSEPQPDRRDMQADASTSALLTLSDPTITEPLVGNVELAPEVTDDVLMANPLSRQPSPGTPEPSMHSMHAIVSQSTNKSPSQQPPPVLLPIKDEHNAPHEDILTPPPNQPKSSCRHSPELGYVPGQEPQVSEQTMMDVDDELLSLVEDRPVRAVPATSKAQVESMLPLSITVGHDGNPGAELGSSEAYDGPPLVSSSQLAPKGPLVTAEDKDRASMPPPAARNKKGEKDKSTLTPGTATGSRKKKDGASKPAAKPKQPPKPRAKPVPKPKVKPNVVETSSKGSIPKGVVNVNARSRSTSVIPGIVDVVVPELDADESDKEDDKLYCVCKTQYDEDRMMIACDRCDEWFHTLCVNMPDLEIDLVDQFICPPCIQKHPNLRTTWKRRCLFGLRHENSSSSKACHKPSRGAFSKYCSDDCGIKYMQTHITQWEKSGGARDLLWESVKNATKREGVVVFAETNGASPKMMDVDGHNMEPRLPDSAARRRAGREVSRLNARLEEVVKERECMKYELDMVMWREKVVELASERAGKVDECGWDQRLCFGEEEWADFGPEVLDSYEEERIKVESGKEAMPLDGTSAMHGEWWCTGKKKCERHAGWQKLRAAEVSFDKETKEGILLKLTTREREIRKCIEDILYPQPTGTLQAPSRSAHAQVQLNGSEKFRSPSHVSERGEKRSS